MFNLKKKKKELTYRPENGLYLHEDLLVLVGRRTNQFYFFKALKAILGFYVVPNNLYSAPGKLCAGKKTAGITRFFFLNKKRAKLALSSAIRMLILISLVSNSQVFMFIA